MRNIVEYENGLIPDSWDVVKLGGTHKGNDVLLEIRNGYTGQQSKPKAKYKVSRIETIGGGYIDEIRVQYIEDVPQGIRDKYLLKKGDILFSHINSDTHLGKTGIALKNYDDLLHGMNLLLFRVNEEVIEPEFLDYIFSFFRQKGVFISICSRAVNQSSINQAKLKSLEIPLPSKIERKNISHILTTLQNAIEKQKQIIDTTQALKKSLLNQLFTQGTKGEKLKETEIGMMPESWKVAPLGKLCKISSGGTPDRTKPEYWLNGTIPWIKTGEIKYREIAHAEEFITELGLKNSSTKISPSGTLLIAMYGQGVTRGRVGILKIPAAINQACAAIVPIDQSKISSEFLYYFFELNYENVRNLGHGANQKNLSGMILKNILVSYPKDINEQKMIFDNLKIIEDKILFHQNKKLVFESLFKTFLNELMTGSIRVDQLEFEV